jgi:nucleotide-binding universal stress UspA family protein
MLPGRNKSSFIDEIIRYVKAVKESSIDLWCAQKTPSGLEAFNFFRRFKMIRRILCPTDLTENSRDSVAYALRLASENAAELVIFHATGFPSYDRYVCELELYSQSQWQEWASRFKMDQIHADAERKVKNFVEAKFKAEAGGVAWNPRVGLGKVSEEIIAAAFQEEVDLIVMARGNRSMVARLLRSSITESVSRGAPCPVLSIDTTQFVGRSVGWKVPLLREFFQTS